MQRRNAEAFNSFATSLLEILGYSDSCLIPPAIQQRLEKVRNRAIAMKLDTQLLNTASDTELLSLIFEPGFSTSTTVTELSGRGVAVAMLTSRSSEKHRRLAMNLGAAAYFSKPYNEQSLLRQLAEWVNT